MCYYTIEKKFNHDITVIVHMFANIIFNIHP